MSDTATCVLFGVWLVGATTMFCLFHNAPDSLANPENNDTDFLPDWAGPAIFSALCILWPVMFTGCFLWALARAVRRAFHV